MADVKIDTTQVVALARDLKLCPVRALPKMRAAIQVAALKIKNDMKQEASASKHFKQLARSITYDTSITTRVASAEIGTTHSGAGNLANIYYFGTSRGGGTGDLTGPLHREAPVLIGFLAAAARDSILSDS